MIPRVRSYLAGAGLGSTLIKAVVGSAGIRLVGMGLAFLVGLQLARGLGAQGYGLYGFAMSIIALAMVPTEFGLPKLVTREVAASQAVGDWGRLRGISAWSYRAVLAISLALVTLVASVLIIGHRYFDPQLSSALLAGLVLVPFVAFSNLNSATLRGLQFITRGQVPDVLIRPAFFSVLLLLATWLIRIELTATIAIVLGSVSAFASYVVSRSMLRHALPAQVLTAKAEVAPGRWWYSALPMALTEAMRVLQAHLVVIIIGALATAATVGIYRVAASVSVLVAMPITLLNVVCAPLISRLFAQNDLVRLQRMLGWASASMIGGVLVLSAPFFIGGEALLAFMFGSEFRESKTPLLILCFSVLTSAFFGSGSSVLTMTGNEKQVSKSAAVSLVFLLASAAPLITHFGSEGAALGTAFSMLVWQVLMWRDARRLVGLETSVFAIFKVSKVGFR